MANSLRGNGYCGVFVVSAAAVIFDARAGLAQVGSYQISALPQPPATMGTYMYSGMSLKGIGSSGKLIVDVDYAAQISDPNSSINTIPMLYQNGQYTPLQIPSAFGLSGQATAINGSGVVVGSTWVGSQNGIQFPMLWTGGSAVPLTMGTYSSGIAYTINDLGIVGGMLTHSDFDAGHAVWWDQNGALHDLGNFGGISADVRGVNNSGAMLVEVTYSDHSNALLLDHGSVQAITWGTFLNNNGHVLAGDNLDGFPQSSLWDGSTYTSLPKLPSDLSGLYWGLNDNDQAVGYSTDYQNINRAILWDNGNFYDLNTLLPPDSGWLLIGATAIANDGNIIGTGYLNDQFRYFLATPDAAGPLASVPEPASAGLSLLVASSVLLRRRRTRAG